MRDYLYLYHDSRLKRLVTSGLEFRDFLPTLVKTGGVLLLDHRYDAASIDATTGYAFVPTEDLPTLGADNIYDYGNFHWVDVGYETTLSTLTDDATAELAFFTHMHRPLRQPAIPNLGNRFLCAAHDDGWHARIYYNDWDAITTLLRPLLANVLQDGVDVVLGRLREGNTAFWCRANIITECERSEDIDALQSKFLPRDWSPYSSNRTP